MKNIIASFSILAVIALATTPLVSHAQYGGGGGGSVGIVGYFGLNPLYPLAGDLTGDRKVDISDFNILLMAWGQSGINMQADLNHDGIIDLGDFTILMNTWTT